MRPQPPSPAIHTTRISSSTTIIPRRMSPICISLIPLAPPRSLALGLAPLEDSLLLGRRTQKIRAGALYKHPLLCYRAGA